MTQPNYQVLARKWRPKSFEQMVGQEHILRMLTNALDQQRLHHAYLFTGTRGVGKTTLARLLAKCLNCETGITSTPCGICKICQAIDTGKFLDLLEIDAASRTKVEDTRELLDNVQYTPTQGRYKIYLIDEVHMLSGHSFNALLKTLEEPPAHVKFLLATTDPKRLPITILSRCLQFHLKRVPPEKISQHLAHICTTEKITHENTALNLLAQAADGSMRDALSLLDQAIAFCGNHVTTQDTRQMLGTIEQQTIFRLLDALADNNGKQLLQEIQTLAEQAPNFQQVLDELISILHQASVEQIINDGTNEAIKKYAAAFSSEDVQLYYQIALIGRRDLPLTPNPQQGFEMVMLRMLAFRPITEKKITETTKSHSITEKPLPTPTKNIPVSTQWDEILPQLHLSGMAQVLASNCTVESLTHEKVSLKLEPAHAPLVNKKLNERIEQALSQYFQRPMKLEISTAASTMETPAKKHQQVQIAKQQHATEAITNDADLKKIMDMFDATLDPNSIKTTG